MKKLLIACLLISSVAFAEGKRAKIASQETGLYPSKACKTKVEGVDGQDPVLRCPAPKGYEVEVSFAAVTTQVSISGGGTKTEFSGLVGNKLEWRIALDGVPFAVLVEMADSDTDGEGKEISKNPRVDVFLLGQSTAIGHAAIKSKKAADKKAAWVKARALADSNVPAPSTK